MSALSLIGLLAPARKIGGIHVSTTVIVIVVLLVIVGGIIIIGWRPPDRAPGEETKAQRDRIDD